MLDSDGSVWIASSYAPQPIYRFDGTVWRPLDLPSDDPVLKDLALQITSMLRGQDGALWLGLSRDGILRLYDGKTWTHFGAEQGVPEKSIGRLFEDRSGVLWAAAGEGGLLRFAPDDGPLAGRRAAAPGCAGILDRATARMTACGPQVITS